MVMRLKASIIKHSLQENLQRKRLKESYAKEHLAEECSDGDGQEGVQVAST